MQRVISSGSAAAREKMVNDILDRSHDMMMMMTVVIVLVTYIVTYHSMCTVVECGLPFVFIYVSQLCIFG